MATTVGSHSVASFAAPINGTSPIDANSVRNNDNTLRTAYVSHDADTGIHLQSSDLNSRPAAGMVGRKWVTADAGSYKLWYDDGARWHEIGGDAIELEVVAGEVLAKGDVVSVTGYNNGLNLATVAKYVGAGPAFGIASEAILNGARGYIINTGYITDVATDTFGATGTILYPAATGTFTSTKPTSGEYQVAGYVLRSNSTNGVLYVEFSGPRIVERSDNTASTVVLRDGSGNFTAGTITATALVGTLATAAQPNVTGIGTLTSLQVDNLNLNGNTLSSTTGGVTIAPLSGATLTVTPSGTDARVDITGTVSAYAGLWLNQSITAQAGFGSALGFGGTVTAAGDGNAIIGIDLSYMSWSNGGFASTTAYGIKLPSVSGGATNYAIHTGAGKVQFGDALTVVSTSGPQASVRYNATNRMDMTVNSSGQVTIASVAATAANEQITLTGRLAVSSSNSGDPHSIVRTNNQSVLQVGTNTTTDFLRISVNDTTDQVTFRYAASGAPTASSLNVAMGMALADSSGSIGASPSTTALALPAGETTRAPIRLPHGSAPSAPVNGDMWTTTAGLFVRINGVTVGPLS